MSNRIVFKLKRVLDPNNLLETNEIELGEHFTKENDGSLFYKHISTGSIIDVSSGSSSGPTIVVQKFGLFITNVEVNTLNASINKTFNASQNNQLISSIESDGTSFRVYVTAFATDVLYKPTVLIKGVTATLTEFSTGIWKGYADINITTENETVHAIHSSGTDVTFTFNRIYKPVITSNTAITSSYPITNSIQQTQIKENDVVTLQIFADQQFKKVRIIDDINNLVKPLEISIPPSTSTVINLQGNSSYSNSVSGENLGIIFQVQSTNNTWSTEYNTKLAKVTPIDAVDYMVLSNVTPILTIDESTADDVVYPSLLNNLGSSGATTDQFGLKTNQYCEIRSTANYYNTVLYENILNHFTITNPTTFSSVKSLQCTLASNNFTNNNFRITLRRNSNGSSLVKEFCIKIVNTAPQFTITKPSGRLQSGGFLGTKAQEYLFTITSDQPLHPNSPISVLTPVTSNIPTFKYNTWIIVDEYSATNKLIVKDSDLKDNFNLINPDGYGLTGISVNNIILNPEVVLGGFVKRTFNIITGTNSHNIGTVVKDETKLKCKVFYYNDEEENSTYINNTTNSPNKFTILNPDTILNTVGDVWSNNDNVLDTLNKSYYTVELEEIP